jgi:hypothetical protein
MRAIRRFVILTAFLMVIRVGSPGQSTACTEEQAKRAFDAVDDLKTWESIRSFFRLYRQCDDGGIGEGVSDAVTKLLADHWTDFGTFVAITGSDPGFEKFVLRHIDATVPADRLQAISKNARDRCPPKSATICKRITVAASSAIKESAE